MIECYCTDCGWTGLYQFGKNIDGPDFCHCCGAADTIKEYDPTPAETLDIYRPPPDIRSEHDETL